MAQEGPDQRQGDQRRQDIGHRLGNLQSGQPHAPVQQQYNRDEEQAAAAAGEEGGTPAFPDTLEQHIAAHGKRQKT